MSYFTTAAVHVTFTEGISPPSVTSFVGQQMEDLLDKPPKRVDSPFSHAFHAPRASWTTSACLSRLPVILVEVCVDLDRLDDLAYKDSLVRDAKRVTVEFLKTENAA